MSSTETEYSDDETVKYWAVCQLPAPKGDDSNQTVIGDDLVIFESDHILCDSSKLHKWATGVLKLPTKPVSILSISGGAPTKVKASLLSIWETQSLAAEEMQKLIAAKQKEFDESREILNSPNSSNDSNVTLDFEAKCDHECCKSLIKLQKVQFELLMSSIRFLTEYNEKNDKKIVELEEKNYQLERYLRHEMKKFDRPEFVEEALEDGDERIGKWIVPGTVLLSAAHNNGKNDLTFLFNEVFTLELLKEFKSENEFPPELRDASTELIKLYARAKLIALGVKRPDGALFQKIVSDAQHKLSKRYSNWKHYIPVADRPDYVRPTTKKQKKDK